MLRKERRGVAVGTHTQQTKVEAPSTCIKFVAVLFCRLRWCERRIERVNGWFRSLDFAEQVILASFIIGVIRIEGHASFVREEDVPLRPINIQIQETREELGHRAARESDHKSILRAGLGYRRDVLGDLLLQGVSIRNGDIHRPRQRRAGQAQVRDGRHRFVSRRWRIAVAAPRSSGLVASGAAATASRGDCGCRSEAQRWELWLQWCSDRAAAAMADRWELWQVRQPFHWSRPALRCLWPHAMALPGARQASGVRH